MYLTYNVADYFDRIVSLDNKKILDFGCNHANFLKYGFEGDYTGVDIDLEVIKQNKKIFPQYKFIHYNTHNNQYNITDKKESIPLVEKYDLITAFSVFTHTSFREFELTITQLKSYLRCKGKILATFIDLHDEKSIKSLFTYRKNTLRNIDMNSFIQNIKVCNTVSIAVNLNNYDTEVYYDNYDIRNYKTPTFFLTMYNGNWVANQLNAKVVDVTDNYQDIRGKQKCLIIE